MNFCEPYITCKTSHYFFFSLFSALAFGAPEAFLDIVFSVAWVFSYTLAPSVTNTLFPYPLLTLLTVHLSG